MPTRGGGKSLFDPLRFAPATLIVAATLLVGAGARAPVPAQDVQPVVTVADSATAATSGVQRDAMDPLLVEVIGFYTGAAGTVDDPRAHELLIEAAADGDTLSVMWMARVYSRGRMLFERDDARAREIADAVIDEVRELAEADHHEAAFLMGTAYAEALGVEENQPLAMAWYHRAADLGNMLAQHNLGNAYREGTFVVQDLGMAAYWYHQAAAQGDALPMYWLGQFYERGEGVAADRDQAIRWYRESAERGRTDAREALQRMGG